MRGSDYAELRAFAEVAGQGSFSRAAERLGMAPSTLSQTVRALEERLDVTLLNRTTRRVSLTGAGARLLDRFAPAMAEIEAAVQDTRDQRLKPRGLVRLHLPRAAYHRHVEPALGRLAETLPEVMLDLTVDDAASDFVADGFDLVVRRGESMDTSLTAVPLGGTLRHVVVASPAYLASQGTPREPAELIGHRCVQWRRTDTHDNHRWRFTSAGEDVTLAVSGPLTVSHCDVAIAAAIAGVGIAYVLEPLAAKSIADGRLVPLLESYLPSFKGWHLCYPRRHRTPTAVLAVVEELTDPP